MKPAKVDLVVQHPYSWDEFPMGDWLAQEIQHQLDLWCPRLFGYHLLKIGGLSAALSCRHSLVRHQLSVGSQEVNCSIQADLLHLPFISSSIDVCLLAHGLEFCSDPHQMLREVERVLTQDGYLILTGFNPFSMMGLGKLIWPLQRRLPWSARMFSPMRVKDWLHLLEFEVVDEYHFGYNLLSRCSHISLATEELGRRFLPAMASNHMLLARKRRVRLTPVGRTQLVRRAISLPSMARVNSR